MSLLRILRQGLFGVGTSDAERDDRRRVLRSMHTALTSPGAVPASHADVRVVGSLDGQEVSCALVGSDRIACQTEIDVPAPGMPLDLDIGPRDRTERRLQRLGLGLDLGTGDAAFDAAFVVEAAPAAAVRVVLDRELRARLLRTEGAYLRYHDDFGVRLVARGWASEAVTLARIEAAVALARRLVTAELHCAPASSDQAGSPYRGEADAPELDEHARLKLLRHRRGLYLVNRPWLRGRPSRL